MNIKKLIMWLGNAFFWGIGLMFIGVIINGVIYEIADDLWLRSLLILILGGIVMHFYSIINDKESYIKTYKDILKK